MMARRDHGVTMAVVVFQRSERVKQQVAANGVIVALSQVAAFSQDATKFQPEEETQ